MSKTETMQHTPGPWKILEVMGEKFVAADPYEGHPYFNRTRTIEIMSDEDYPTKDADIYLIAAAPNLLAMCKLIMAEWESDARSTQCFDSRIITGTRLAIQKAEGRA
jgi:hypothetical protein